MLNNKSFAPYGTIIGPQDSKPSVSNSKLDFWLGTDEIKLNNGIGQICWLEVKYQHSFICDSLECHMNSSEALIPMLGQSIIVVGLSEVKSDSGSLPDVKSIKAFFIDGTNGVNFKPGVWHWLPYPLSKRAHFALVFKKGTPDEDLWIIDLSKELDLSIKLVLEK